VSVGEPHGQLARRQLRKLQRQVDDLTSHILRDAIPDAIGPGPVVGQRFNAALTIAVIPTNGMDGSPSRRRLRACNRKENYNDHRDAGY
jgi:hypothetical protein